MRYFIVYPRKARIVGSFVSAGQRNLCKRSARPNSHDWKESLTLCILCVCTPWVPVCLSLNSQQGTPLSSLTDSGPLRRKSTHYFSKACAVMALNISQHTQASPKHMQRTSGEIWTSAAGRKLWIIKNHKLWTIKIHLSFIFVKVVKNHMRKAGTSIPEAGLAAIKSDCR